MSVSDHDVPLLTNAPSKRHWSFACGYCKTIEALADPPVLVAARHLIHRMRKAQAITAALDAANVVRREPGSEVIMVSSCRKPQPRFR
ncbi:MAG TPA: hypothetical protein VK604_27935 [Bryobacteraceae bacterium]|nr:hypothetical protein [Bryobacteraceae bacterium]